MKKIKYLFAIGLVYLMNINNILAITKVSCGNVTGIPAKIPELTSFVVTIIQIAVPIILVIMGMLDLFKGITAQKEDEMTKGRKMFIKRLIVAGIIFFIVVIVKLIVSIVSDATSSANITGCIDCFLSNDCLASSNSNSNLGVTSTKVKNDNSSKTPLPKTSSANKNKSKDKAKTTSTPKVPVTSSTNKITNYLFVGDSRTVGMCGTYKLCGTNEYIAATGKGYSWFNNTAVISINNKIQQKKYNIIILMGVNDVGSNGTSAANNYFSKISELAKTTWKNQNIIFVSVNPVRDGKSYAYMSGVNSFNSTMNSKISSINLSNLKYCDTASSLNIDNIDSGDGLHYNKDGYSLIYNHIMNKCLK